MRADEHHLGNAHHFLAERVLGAIRLSNYLLPVLDKTLGHVSAEQDGVAGVSEMVDERLESFIHVPGHPVQLALLACDKAVNSNLHLQFEFSQWFLRS